MREIPTKEDILENGLMDVIKPQLTDKQIDIAYEIVRWTIGKRYGSVLRGDFRKYIIKKYSHLLSPNTTDE